MKIEGYFSTIKNADMAVDKLKASGLSNAYRDINDHVGLNNNAENSVPGTETAPSLASLVLNSGEPINNLDKSPLAAASPMVSGMGEFNEIADVSYKVIVDVNSNETESAKKIIKEMGGDTEYQNLDISKHIVDMPKDIDYNDLDL